MLELPQFILVRIERDPTNPQKFIKKPVDKNGTVSSAFDQNNWGSQEEMTELKDALPAPEGTLYALGS